MVLPETDAISPATRSFPIGAAAGAPIGRLIKPEEVAAFALFLCRDDAASITGANLSMDGGWTAA